MKKGFTMIELIFVIVILGILAAVAIPKLNATRDDAEQAKLATNITTAMGDFASYYTAKGSFYTTGTTKVAMNALTNVPLDSSGKLQVKTKDCLTFAVEDGTKIKITPAAVASMDPVCKKVLAQDGIRAALTNASGTQVVTAVASKMASTVATSGVSFDYASSGVSF
ncbi:prepilin-type N-terminal cleavage/methylation domain-containing protein [Campylobacter sp. 2018MI01]|uniref:type II secretion system protein n=1 Tax=Campylobacter sp. 2018MI01 TaxID=2836735 RepID=UPI001BD9AE85|nr:prepilin-type N-terminal cleavage/methylation domain-containing protein [Campylobacter sp. 2018MI01]MBT0877832.1 prepilin-type N-terminal cleavage/methylation domain-containing protein [Campylobacter sp. 2018MI01]